jgi:ATP-binding cassette subfamily B multidrug efflux pump
MQQRLQRRFIPWLFHHVFEFWYYYLGALVALVFLHTFQSKIPLMAKELGDQLLGEAEEAASWKEFLLMALAILVFRTFSRLLFFYPARVQQKLLRMEVVNYIEAAHPKKYETFNEGQLFQIIINDFNRLRGLVGFGLLQVGNIIIAATIFIPKIREFDADFLIAFSPLLGCMAIFMTLIIIFQPYAKKEMDLNGEVQNFIIESYDAKSTIQNYHAEESFYGLFKEQSWEQLKAFYIGSLGRSIAFPMVKLGVGASLLWGAQIVFDKGMSGTSLIFFSGFLFLVLEPLMFISWIGVVVSHAWAAWVRIKELLNSIDGGFDTQSLNQQDNKILFWDQWIDLDVKPGQWTVLVGETGVGKSYLLEREADLLKLQGKNVSMVHQEPYLYNDTIKNNIFLGLEIDTAKEKLAKELLVLLGLDVLTDDIDELLKLEVGENGKKVSGGQAKRICLIRSLLSGADTIIWDDPFSSVDLLLEKDIMDKLKSSTILKDKTFLLSSHRLTTVRYCDYVVYLRKSEGIVETGMRKQLLENKESEVSGFFKKQLV